ncbi:hypothetical protein LRS06_10525 [Hymenobacter sp. J193]|uniref:hypothetical protein n=1 Tax=Hymenobacter sp. J193 TaxID=2898429 RepID=UPI002151DA73|nr:hypothetical protein [Hymenobacter sp. J193]MCR5888191.1 hypothetical protein [Hymenobacter sp. J193]
MAISEDILRENYRKLSDAKLLSIATDDAVKLRPDALALLKAELQARGLAEAAQSSIEAQFKVLDEAGLHAYCAMIQEQPCPICQSSSQPLNATISYRVVSFIIMTTRKKEFAIACPPCLDALNRQATISSALLGWWGIPWGIIHTIRALIKNNAAFKNNHLPQPNDLLKGFVAENVGRIEAAKGRPDMFQQLLGI